MLNHGTTLLFVRCFVVWHAMVWHGGVAEEVGTQALCAVQEF